MSLLDNSRIDFIKEFYSRGLHNVLEEIVLRLPIRTILSCKEVNDIWRQIILFYHQSENPRIVKIQDQRISKEWKKKTPIIHQLSLEQFLINQVSCFQIIGDEMQVIAAANINQTKFAKIIVIDADTFKVEHILNLKNEEGENLEVLEIKMAMDENFLAAFVSDGDGRHFYRVWNRSDNFSDNKIQRFCLPQRLSYIGPHIANIPFLHDGRLLIYKREFQLDAVYKYEEQDLAHYTVQQLTEVTPGFDFWILTVYRLRNGMLTLQQLTIYHNLVLSYRRGNSVVWQKNFHITHRPTLIWFDEEYFVLQKSGLLKSDQITIYKIETGQPMLSFFSRAEKGFNLKCEAQISNTRVAYKGAICPDVNFRQNCEIDLVIMNFVTGEKLLSCTKDLGFSNISKFFFQKEKLVLEQNGSLNCVLFWH